MEPGRERWEILPIITHRTAVLFPGVRCEAVVGTVEALRAIREGLMSWGPKSVAVFTARAPRHAPGDDRPLEIYDVGTAADILNLRRRPDLCRWVVDLRIRCRLRVCEHLQVTPFRIARVERISDPDEDGDMLRCLGSVLRDSARKVLALAPSCRHQTHRTMTANRLGETTEATELLAIAMQMLRDLPIEDQQRALELPTVSARLDFVRARLVDRLVGVDPGARGLLQ